MNMNCSSAADNDRLPRKISPPSSANGKNLYGLVGGMDQSVSHHNKNHQNKRNSKHGSNNSNLPNKRQKFRHERMDLDPLFPKLNQNDPIHARRIQQRRRAVAIGKNTPGYAEYCKQVPKERRKPFSMETPPTPDHTLDIPTKRWQGMVNAW
jgi:Histone RNA hairpin-binding protein RNA-binding domain